MNNRRGIAEVVVLFFAIFIALFMCVLLESNTSLFMQNRKTLGQLQAYYLAQSALQHAILKLRLLPKETYDAFRAGATVPFPDVDSDLHPQIRFARSSGQDWSLYVPGVDIDTGPIDGKYELKAIRLESSLNGMSLVQDGYQLEVQATVRGTGNMTFVDGVSEQIIVSRFTGDVGL